MNFTEQIKTEILSKQIKENHCKNHYKNYDESEIYNDGKNVKVANDQACL